MTAPQTPPPTQESTEALVRAWTLDGCRVRFAELERRLTPYLLGCARRSPHWPVLAPTHQPQDVAQEVWLRLARSAARTFTSRGPGSFRRYLGTVCRRTLLDLVKGVLAARKGGGRQPRELEATTDPAAGGRILGQSPTPTPTAQARLSEIEALALEGLSRAEFEAWELVERQGRTSAEAGAVMGRSAAAVRGLTFRAKIRLVDLLHRKGYR